jgi:hypothetical protein
VASGPCITIVVTSFSKIFQACKDCHGSCSWFYWWWSLFHFSFCPKEQITQLFEPSFAPCWFVYKEVFPYQVTYGMCSNVNVTHGQGWYVWFKKDGVQFMIFFDDMTIKGWEVRSFGIIPCCYEKFSIMRLSPKFQELYNIYS